jgi:hypothetical protein
LLKASPPELNARTVLEYAALIEDTLLQLYNVLPKLCVPVTLFRTLEKESVQINELAENYMKEHRRSLIEIRVLEERLKESEDRERTWMEEKKQILKSSEHYRKKAQIMKRSGEESVKHLLEASSDRGRGSSRHSLPRLDKR